MGPNPKIGLVICNGNCVQCKNKFPFRVGGLKSEIAKTRLGRATIQDSNRTNKVKITKKGEKKKIG